MKLVIGASRNNKIGSRLIRWWINAPYSHVYARWYLQVQDRDIVYQSSHEMVHFTSFENLKKDNTIVYEIELELTNEQFKQFSTKCIDLAGQPYSKSGLVQIFLFDITKKQTNIKDQSGYICSELMGELLEDLGYKFSKPNYLINPKDIIEELQKQQTNPLK